MIENMKREKITSEKQNVGLLIKNMKKEKIAQEISRKI